MGDEYTQEQDEYALVDRIIKDRIRTLTLKFYSYIIGILFLFVVFAVFSGYGIYDTQSDVTDLYNFKAESIKADAQRKTDSKISKSNITRILDYYEKGVSTNGRVSAENNE